MQPLGTRIRAKGYRGMWKRVPIEPCSLLSPFIFPLNLAALKIAPALSVGCPFVTNPALKNPARRNHHRSGINGQVLAETDLPEGAFAILPCSRGGADLFTTDDQLKP